MEKISVIIINYNTPEITKQALQALVKNQDNFDLEIILIDNESKEKVVQDEWFHKTVHTYIENPENKGFAGAVNQGIKIATGAYIFLLNSDAFISEGALTGLVSFLKENEAYGIVGPKTINADRSFQVSAGRFPSLWGEFLVASKLYKKMKYSLFLMERGVEGNTAQVMAVDWVSGGCMLIKRVVIDQIGLLDPHFFFGVEDMDYCYRAKKRGFFIGYLPSVVVTHLHGYSGGGTRSRFKLEYEAAGKEYFFHKHFPQKIITRLFIASLYWIRICLLGLFGKLK